MSERKKRVALVLGAGGPVGHAYQAGVLRALERKLGWDPRTADLIVGTSAGAQVGALLRAGMTAEDISARIVGDELTEAGQAIAQHYVRPSHEAPPGSVRRLRPAAPQYLRRAFARPWDPRPGRFVAALLPEGRVSLDPQAAGLRRVFGSSWPELPLWITAVELKRGRRVVFGRDGDPQTDVGTAVISSGAVPSVCVPVEVEGRHYVDGAVASATHLDVLEGDDVDAVIVISPLSVMIPMRFMLSREVRRLRRCGKQVIRFEPRGPVAKAMGWNMMDLSRVRRVAQLAYAATSQAIEEGDERVEQLESLGLSPSRRDP